MCPKNNSRVLFTDYLGVKTPSRSILIMNFLAGSNNFNFSQKPPENRQKSS